VREREPGSGEAHEQRGQQRDEARDGGAAHPAIYAGRRGEGQPAVSRYSRR
jgi:hypothetical protein